ncbi:hypothetical protein JYU34_021737 [Plutella xylostella]|uniref:Uncharacterized protein n=2 Tax=Plutella xylostella TaxID=51655 RepID=A0ABQ7PRB9_PLUXY|nr:CUE domain-containing protein 2 [Plutella xylostella]KAG7295526.1 hypothetical protein JYU34_021737 [Plutella xylostella]CAG9131730.1 unnamed protein product [Plutella xylostella]
MSSIAQQESLVKESLFQFITRNIPSADLNGIDDIVLSYVISILEEASQDPCFDVEGFIEMMAAYVPEFDRIEADLVLSWVLELEAELTSRGETDSLSHDDSAGSDRISLTLQSLTEMLPPANKGTRSHSNSSSSSDAADYRRPLEDDTDTLWHEQTRALADMFPNTATMEIKHCISIAHGSLERAAATLLHRREQGQALSAAALHCAARAPEIDDRELKSRIIARYSYVDKDAETKEHKPLAPKIEPKKMVRYRDNKIVSLKGERYTEVPKSGADEENLKKPKKQHCP